MLTFIAFLFGCCCCCQAEMPPTPTLGSWSLEALICRAPWIVHNRLLIDHVLALPESELREWTCFHSNIHRWAGFWACDKSWGHRVTSLQNGKSCLFSWTRLKDYFISKSSSNTWKNYWKFVSKTWDCPNTSVFKRLKTPGELFFFLCEEEEFHLVIMLLKRKTERQEKEKRVKKKTALA